jgi:hypothetical protein
MTEPVASRPLMPGYGVLPADEGSGLLPWSWALARIHDSHDFWVATVWPDGRPHLSPVWGVWDEDALWFSASPRSRKMRNIRAGSAVSVSTEDPENPVVLEGTFELVTELEWLVRFVGVVNLKYRVEYSVDFFASDQASVGLVRPQRAFGLKSSDFEGSPTRWTFPSG